MATKCTNIFQNPEIKNNCESARYSDPLIKGMGSAFKKKGCKTNYKQTASQKAAFGPDSKLAKENPAQAAKIMSGIKSDPNSPKEAHCK
tara:strand:+ start:292 stop:558 length:267 start_codon:yes stop_codon:yes gene_type:complete